MSVNLYVDSQVAIAPKQKELIDSLTEESPLLQSLPVIQASSATANVYEKLLKVTGGSTVELDAPVPSGLFESKLEKTNLSKIQFKAEAGLDKISKFGGPTSYFGKQIKVLLKATGSAMEASLITDVLRAHAVDTGNVIDVEGSTADKQSSIVAVRWGEDATIGLTSKEMAGQGKTFDVQPLYGGNTYLDSNDIACQGMLCTTFLGLQIGDPGSVNAICNIQLTGTAKLPTAAQIDDLILSVKGGPGNTVLLCHPAIYNKAIKPLVTRTYSATDGNANASFGHWDGIPVLATYNYAYDTEAVVS
jgi:hypothetical protein